MDVFVPGAFRVMIEMIITRRKLEYLSSPPSY
jgi:hypothetical protein